MFTYSKKCVHTDLKTILVHKYLDTKQDTAVVFDKWNVKCQIRATRYQRGNQNPYIEEEQTTQWPQKKKRRINNDLQNIHIKLKIE